MTPEHAPTSVVSAVRERTRTAVSRAARTFAERLGHDVVRQSIYSPVPGVPPPDDPLWGKRYHLEGLRMDLDTQIGFVEERLARWVPEFEDAMGPAAAAGRFTLWNGQYQPGDAELLYALLRELRPRRVLELGSGFSTYVSAAACARNAQDGDPSELIAVDPDPRTALSSGIDGLTRLELRDCRELPLDRFEALDAGDVLFVDTSHVVKLGSEVNWLVLELLPLLRAGVFVHFHDVFLPYEYPRYLFELEGYFNEQYLLHAFLLGNREWEVVLAACALARGFPDRLRRVVPSLAQPVPGMPGFPYVPAAFWIRRSGAPERSGTG